MEKIYSKMQPGTLLHIINRQEEIGKRTDIVPSTMFIQCASIKLKGGTTFKPHKHIFKEREFSDYIAQESWVVIKGSVRCILYDLDDTVIATPVLKAGDASFTLFGGHNYEILEDDTIVYEYKIGPYEGQASDKKFLDV